MKSPKKFNKIFLAINPVNVYIVNISFVKSAGSQTDINIFQLSCFLKIALALTA